LTLYLESFDDLSKSIPRKSEVSNNPPPSGVTVRIPVIA
jgi:hypothetical protein